MKYIDISIKWNEILGKVVFVLSTYNQLCARYFFGRLEDFFYVAFFVMILFNLENLNFLKSYFFLFSFFVNVKGRLYCNGFGRNTYKNYSYVLNCINQNWSWLACNTLIQSKLRKIYNSITYSQKQPSRGVLKKRYSENI